MRNDLPPASGIYQIVNTITGKRYVGQSINIRKRIGGHLISLRAGRHECRYLQYAFAKHGADAFRFEVLELAERDALDEVEQRWLDAGFATGDLYNSERNAKRSAREVPKCASASQKLSERQRRLFADPVWRSAQLARLQEIVDRPEVRAKMSATRLAKSAEISAHMSAFAKKRFAGPEGKAEHARLMAIRANNPSFLDGLKERGRKWRSNPTAVANHDAAIKRRSLNPEWRAMMAARNMDIATRTEWRAKITAARSTPEAKQAQGIASKQRWEAVRQDPIAYAARCKAISDAKKRRFSEDPAMAARVQEAAKAGRLSKKAGRS